MLMQNICNGTLLGAPRFSETDPIFGSACSESLFQREWNKNDFLLLIVLMVLRVNLHFLGRGIFMKPFILQPVFFGFVCFYQSRKCPCPSSKRLNTDMVFIIISQLSKNSYWTNSKMALTSPVAVSPVLGISVPIFWLAEGWTLPVVWVVARHGASSADSSTANRHGSMPSTAIYEQKKTIARLSFLFQPQKQNPTSTFFTTISV